MEAIKELAYAMDTFYFLVSGALVMWMAAGFAMLEAGLVRKKYNRNFDQKYFTICSRLYHVHADGLCHHVSRRWRS